MEIRTALQTTPPGAASLIERGFHADEALSLLVSIAA
ncbi:MAG: hypothetical protein ACI841_002568 [Planctomycetota bacterium]|jgi:hypothetical protein